MTAMAGDTFQAMRAISLYWLFVIETFLQEASTSSLGMILSELLRGLYHVLSRSISDDCMTRQ